MSRVGRAPIAVPGGVTVTVAGTLVTVAGPQGTLERPLPGAITVRQEEAKLSDFLANRFGRVYAQEPAAQVELEAVA